MAFVTTPLRVLLQRHWHWGMDWQALPGRLFIRRTLVCADCRTVSRSIWMCPKCGERMEMIRGNVGKRKDDRWWRGLKRYRDERKARTTVEDSFEVRHQGKKISGWDTQKEAMEAAQDFADKSRLIVEVVNAVPPAQRRTSRRSTRRWNRFHGTRVAEHKQGDPAPIVHVRPRKNADLYRKP